MHSGWQGGFPLEQVSAPMSGFCSESSFGVTSPCLWTIKEKLTGEAESLRLSSLTVLVSFEAGASGKTTFKTKPAAAFRLLFLKGSPDGLSYSWGKRPGLFSFLIKPNVVSRTSGAWQGRGCGAGAGSGEQGVCSLRGCQAVCAWRSRRALRREPPGAATARGAEPPALPGAAGARKGEPRGGCRGAAEGRGSLRRLPAVTGAAPRLPGGAKGGASLSLGAGSRLRSLLGRAAVPGAPRPL